MARLLYEIQAPGQRKWPTAFLAFFWSAGLLSGIALYLQSGDFIVTLMRMAVSSRVSIVNLLITNLLPFVLSALAVYTCQPVLLYAIAFCKAFLLSFVSAGTVCAYGCAGWMIRPLLMFSDICLAGLLYLFLQRCLTAVRYPSPVSTCAYFAAVILIGSVDYTYIAPFLAQLINF